MRNPFRNKTMRLHFDAMVRAHDAGHRDLFLPNGTRRRGSTVACAFWDGFDNRVSFYARDADARTRLTYACWRAGRAVALRNHF